MSVSMGAPELATWPIPKPTGWPMRMVVACAILRDRGVREMIKKALPVILMLALLPVGCGQPQAPPMVLVPFTSQAWSIRGVAPEGWVETRPGHFSGAEWPFNQLMYEFFPARPERRERDSDSCSAAAWH